MNQLQASKNKIRDQSRTKIKEYLNLKDTVFSQIEADELETLSFDLEDEVFKKHPEVDTFYRKRIVDICENLKLLKDYKDISDLIVVKKALSIGKLLQN
jgi:hypothetical protein